MHRNSKSLYLSPCQQLSYFWRTSLIHSSGFLTSILHPEFAPPGLMLYFLHSKTKLEISLSVSCKENKEADKKNFIINALSHWHNLSVHLCGSFYTCYYSVWFRSTFTLALLMGTVSKHRRFQQNSHTHHTHPTPNTNQVLL